MIPLNYLSVARFSGSDAGDFLHRQLSADIAALAPGDASFACCCTPKGQVIGLLLVCRQDDDYLVAGAAELLPAVLARLKMFILRSRVELGLEDDLTVRGFDDVSELCSAGVFQPAGLELGYGFFGEPGESGQAGERFKTAEIRKHVTWLGAETSEKFIPQMLGYDQIGAVSFSKGCYPGQEIVARARYLGKVKRKPVIVRVFEPIAVSAGGQVELLRGETWVQGVVIDSAGSDDGTLLFVVAPFEPEGESVELRCLDRNYRCATM